MYPHDLPVLSFRIAIWNAMLLVGILLGYPVVVAALRARCGGRLPRLVALRWVATAYVSAVGAQLFAYLFDLNTSVLPPPGVGWARYYLDPSAGPKTLYGAIVFLPVTALAISVPWRDLSWPAALDGWTPAMFVVLAVARVGCFLQGCCYGIPSAWFGLSFPPHGALHWSQVEAGVIPAGSWTAPVLPTQLLEATALLALAAWSFRALRGGRRDVFVPGVMAYSACRVALEIVRADPDRNQLGPFSTSQWIALAVLGLAFARHRFAGSRAP
jgi:prolipoprotein diacylglyceryltransferase